MGPDTKAEKVVLWIAAMLMYTIIGAFIGVPMYMAMLATSERHVVIRVLAPIAAGAAVVTLVVLTVTSDGGGGGGGDYFDVCWDSPGGAYRC